MYLDLYYKRLTEQTTNAGTSEQGLSETVFNILHNDLEVIFDDLSVWVIRMK